MRARRGRTFLVEPPSSATGDIAFNLIVFFLVCASVQPDSGRLQTLPRSEEVEQQKEKIENIEVRLTRTTALLNGEVVPPREFPGHLRRLLDARSREEDRVVIVKSEKETPYHHWVRVTEMIETAGGVITIQREEEREVVLPN
ncbi:MAG: biopolymer transporter ExbD [Planctomycetaceae bacterium]|nr:biopolymer transporter ExbD [Planctomycetaceae bacterium]